ncbi:hypothetical protein HDV04_000993 [Boothiomyces sp. JEL0838]|nr:hypothetical protein HDV04_000993 [Boothiomyces sp. JEL0838]
MEMNPTESPYLTLAQMFQVNMDIAVESALPGDLPISGIPEETLDQLSQFNSVNYGPNIFDINGYTANSNTTLLSDTNSIAEELFSTDEGFQVSLVRSDSLSSQLSRTSSISKIKRSTSLTKKPELKRTNSQKKPELERSKSLKTNWKLNKTSDGYKCPLLKDHLHKEELEFIPCGEKRAQAKEMKNHLLLGHGIKANIRGDVILF